MRRRLLHMISPTSLSAFSASVTNGAVLPGAGVDRAAGVSKARVPPQAGPASGAATGTTPLPQGMPPGQRLPRGSLLNLSV